MTDGVDDLAGVRGLRPLDEGRPDRAGRPGIGLAPFGVGALAAAFVTLALAWPLLLPGLGLWDTAEFQAVGPLLGTAHPTGYPTYVILGWFASIVLQPLGSPAFRLDALAAILAAVTAGICAILVGQLTRRPLLATAAGIVVGASPVAWRLATHADPHGLHGALVAGLLSLLVAWESTRRDAWLVAAAALFGLALGNHSLTLFLAPGIALFVLAVDRRILRRGRLVLRCALVLLVTAGLVYLELPLRAGPFRAPLVYGSPETLVGFLYVVSGAQFTGAVATAGLADRLATTVAAATTQLGPLAILVPVALVVAAVRRPRYVLLTGPAVVLTCWFAASYVNAEIDRYYLGPAIIAVTWLAILADAAVDAVASALHAMRLTGAAPRTGALPARGAPGRWVRGGLALELVAALLLLAPTLADLTPRAAAVDRSQDVAGRQWVDDTLGLVQRDALVVSWWDYSTALWYAQLVEGRRPDVTVVDDRTRLDQHLGEVTDVIDANLGRRPVYVVRLPAELPAIEARYRLEYLPIPGSQPVARVVGRRTTAVGVEAAS